MTDISRIMDDLAALETRFGELEAERDAYRIEADCCLRDYDGLELDAGIMHDALEKIADGRPNRTFDPWAREVARIALAELKNAAPEGEQA